MPSLPSYTLGTPGLSGYSHTPQTKNHQNDLDSYDCYKLLVGSQLGVSLTVLFQRLCINSLNHLCNVFKAARSGELTIAVPVNNHSSLLY